MATTTKEEVRAVFDVLAAMLEVIRTKGEIPSGELYAWVMGKMDIRTYEAMIATIKRTGLVVEKNDLLMWVGPKL